MATERGRRRRSSAARANITSDILSGRTILLAHIIRPQTRLVAFVVNELLDAVLAAFVIETVGGLLGANQVVLRIVVGHLLDAANGIFRRLEGDRVFLEELVAHLRDPGFKLSQ